ncbi:ER membrane protein complex subunit 4-like [Amphibalanus amphitrite]|uniref:ER membrane protein complex subunit 4-like n=1 Tax=Amphibalanus amphitrite TaxID=1232801 RepID=UPI001C8FBFFA|nr:ER membrane protein complex subunit 4-like [Amphibalanus amphitrite]XP_043226611.1 ER membrane protein complex subunit 4-like [Amphibalanus amphitrite]
MSKAVANKGSRWALDFTVKGRNSDLPAPPGYSLSVNQSSEVNKANDASLVIKRAWDLALSPLKQIPMNLFIMYMAGDSISIFPIMMIGMMLLRTVKALFSIQQTFKMIEGDHAILQRLVYLIGILAGIALALYKCHSMGLLPTHASDWLAFVEPQQRVEYAFGGVRM